MQTPLGPFRLRNLCTSLLEGSIDWLADVDQQRKDWDATDFPDSMIDTNLECFLESSDYFLKDSPLSNYPNLTIICLLKSLKKIIINFYLSEKLESGLEKEVFFERPYWINIQNIAQEIKSELEKIIEKGSLD
jgi:hypothetical protein